MILLNREIPKSCAACELHASCKEYLTAWASAENRYSLGQTERIKECPMKEINTETAFNIVYEELTSSDGCQLFRGIYDARNGKEDYMYGISTVMEYIANQVSEQTCEEFQEMFYDNMRESEWKAHPAIYVIMVCTKLEEGIYPDGKKSGFPKYGERCTVGYYKSLADAENALATNATDMWETCYDYACIERVQEGLCRPGQLISWYKYNKEKDGYLAIDTPEFDKHTCGRTIG